MKTTKVCIVGGTGFVGRHLINRLADDGIRCRVLTRRPHRHRHFGLTPGTELRQIDAFDAGSLAAAFEGQEAVVNLVGILNETGGEGFRKVHYDLPVAVLEACRKAGIGRLLHMSALNADETHGTSEYLRTKGAAEDHVHAHAGAVAVTSFRPSVIFGPDDSFFNRFAQLLRLPGPFPLACPTARFAPVYVGDVAEAFARSLDDPATFGQRYDLCGPRAFTLREIVEYTAEAQGNPKPIVPLSDALSRLQARILGVMPGRPFTMDNYLSTKMDSVCRLDGLGMLGIEPTDVDAIMPYVLGRRRPKEKLDEYRRAH
jgi:NADH dehydrogenase